MKTKLLMLAAAVIFPLSGFAQLNFSVSGSITSSDPTENGRLSRNGVASQAGTQKPFPGTLSLGIFHYDSYTIVNTTGADQALYIDFTASFFPTDAFSVAYLGSFDPNNIATNYLGDAGISPEVGNPHVFYSVTFPVGQTVVLVVNEVTSRAGVPSYTLAASTTPFTVPEYSSTFALGLIGFAVVIFAAWRQERRVAICHRVIDGKAQAP
jgi:hypothetical protein